ncbi:MAG: protoporphyrinogen/coproporphyrinogen oxidase [Planctomycetota bacterium]
MQNAKTVVIGAGPTGLAVAYHLNGSSIVLESGDSVGGLCRSFEMSDVVFDIGGHSFHTLHEKVHSFVCEDLGVDMFFQGRDARILFNGEVVPYPWQKFFHLVKDQKVIEDCHTGLRTRKQHITSKNLHDLILAKYGKGIARHFLFPYNKKLWLRNLDEISCEWASQRIADLADKAAVGASKSAQRRPLDEASVVGYPSKGGFGGIFRKMAARIDNIHFGQHVSFIDPHVKALMTRSGNVFKWDTIVSTMPIPELIGMIKNAPSDIVRLARELPYVSLQVDFFVTKEPLGEVPQRLYSADAEFPPHKVAFNSMSSKHEKNKPHHSIIAETSIGDESEQSCRDRTDRIVKGLSAAGLIEGRQQILMHRYELVKYAYPVQSHQVTHIMNLLSRYLDSQQIYTLGRFGRWEYINSDECLLKGAELAEYLDSNQGRARASGDLR